MSKFNMAVTAALVGLLGIQTYRVHGLRRQAALTGHTEAGQDARQGTQQAQPDLEGLPGSPTGRPASSPGGSEKPGAGLPGSGPSEESGQEEGEDPWDDGQALNRLPVSGDFWDALLNGETDAASGSSGKDKKGGAGAKGKGSKNALSQEAQRFLQQARDATERGEYGTAVELLQECLEADPTVGRAYQTLAGIYRMLGQTDDQMQAYGDWIAQCPNDEQAYYQLACTYESLGMNDEALDNLRIFERLSADDMNAYSRAASLYRRLDMRDAEGAVLEDWARKAPDSPVVHRTLAQYYSRTNNRQQALNEYQRVVELTPDNAMAHRSLASAYQQLRLYDAAQAELVTAMNLRPEDIGVRLQLGDVYRQSGDLQTAMDTYFAIMEDAPGSSEAVRAQRSINNIERQINKPPKPKKPKALAQPAPPPPDIAGARLLAAASVSRCWHLDVIRDDSLECRAGSWFFPENDP